MRPRRTPTRGSSLAAGLAIVVAAAAVAALASGPFEGTGGAPGALSWRSAAPGIRCACAADDDHDRRALARLRSPPRGLPPVPVPADNPPTAAKIRLGRTAFLDRRLSVNGSLSCAMCHVPEQGFTVNELRTAVGHEGASLRRNAPTLLNVAYAGPFFHDGREPSLDLQALDVLTNPDEMAAPSLGAVEEKLRSLPPYPELFEEAFGGPPTVAALGRAVATYLRTLLAADSHFDRWRYGGDEHAMSEAAQRGFALFTGRAGCVRCHHVEREHALFSDGSFHDTGLGHLRMQSSHDKDPVAVELAPGFVVAMARSAVDSVGERRPPDRGRAEVTGDPADRWRFKTPSLRNVALTAPYMHDGSLSTLADVVRFYSRGGHPHDGIDPLIRPLELSESEVAELVAFLESLTGAGIDELVRDARSQAVGNPGGRAAADARRHDGH